MKSISLMVSSSVGGVGGTKTAYCYGTSVSYIIIDKFKLQL